MKKTGPLVFRLGTGFVLLLVGCEKSEPKKTPPAPNVRVLRVFFPEHPPGT